jgi:sugar-specific transcriptional regulator TrmB
MNRFHDALVTYGLDEKEAKVYVAILELGEATIQRIADKAKVRRTTVYDVIGSLKTKGLLGKTIKKKRSYYFVSDPRDLIEKLDERKGILHRIMPELLSIANIIDKKPRIKFFEGEEGIKEVYLDTLKYPKQPIYAWVTDQIWSTLDVEFIDHYIDNRVKNGIPAYVIAPDTPTLKEYRAKESKFLRKTLLESDSRFKISVEIDLYGDQSIGVMAFEERIGLVVESKKLWETLKSIFDIHWRTLGGEEI